MHMRTKKHSALFILVLLVGMLVNARDADARSYASLDEPIGEGLAVAADAFSRASTAGDPSLSVTAAAVGNGGGAGLPLLWSNLTSRIGSGMYAAYCLVFCEEHSTNTRMVMNDANTVTHPVMNRYVSETSTTSAQPSTANTQQPSGGSPSTPPSSSHDTSHTVHDTHPAIVYTVLGISESDLAGALASLESRLLPQIRAARESARSNRSRSESNPRPTFLTLPDVFDTFSPYAIPFTDSGGTSLTQSSSFIYQNDKLGVSSSTPTETLSVGGSAHLAGYLTLDQTSAPTITTDRLYNSAGDLYWAGNLIGGATTGVWASNGSDVWRAGGRVGIGTTTPVHTLTVSTEVPLTDVDISALQGAGGKATIRAINNANQQTQITTFGYNATSTSLWSGVPSSGLSVWYANGVNAALVNHGAGDLYLINQYAVPRMTIASTTGYVGVATMNPKYRFDVSGAGRFTSFVDANYFVATGTQASSFPYASTTALTVSGTAYVNALSSASALPLPHGYILRGSSGNTAEATSTLFVAASGNVGVGTVSPNSARKLHVYQSNGGYSIGALFETAVSSSYIAFQDTVNISESNVRIGSEGNNLAFRTNNTEKLRIDSSGNVGIGTTSPTTKLHIHGSSQTLAQIQSTDTSSYLMFADTGSTIVTNQGIGSNGTSLILRTNGGTRAILTNAGNFGIGTTSPAFKLSVAGDVYASAFIDDGVTLAAPDYVFDDPHYVHLSLADIEAYTEAHKHLPWLTPRGSGAMSISARINEVLEALENLFLEVFELADWNRRQDEADAIRDQRIDALEAELRAFKAGSGSSQSSPGPAEQGGPGAEPASSSLSSSEGDDAESTEPEQTPPIPSEQAVDAADAPASTATSEAPEFSEPATLDSGAVTVSGNATSF
ncbi:exported hypothetical protein [uncultured Defluviicoccus sp.]|uniref:Peptidase S74 domain-containing protein n=1 Tax=metagenome TaxID=256318 RepID=A0A380TK64_9ZZZZ|nr:exported hypothetical protein [uncultured Defluviicoccus sp.]